MSERDRKRGRHGYLTKIEPIDRDGITHFFIGSYKTERALEKAIEKRKRFGNFTEIPLSHLNLLKVLTNGRIRLYVGLKSKKKYPSIISPTMSVMWAPTKSPRGLRYV